MPRPVFIRWQDQKQILRELWGCPARTDPSINNYSTKFTHTCAEFLVNETSWILLLPPLVSRVLFRCLIFNCYNISICKKGEVKDETSKKFMKVMEVNRTYIGFTNFQKRERSKIRHQKKFVKPMEVKLRSKMSHWPKV